MSNVSLINGHIDGANTCVVCGRVIPEGKQVCVICGHTNKTQPHYDLVKSMSIEELAQFMNDCGHDFPPYCDYKDATRGICDQNCLKRAKEWLETEVNT